MRTQQLQEHEPEWDSDSDFELLVQTNGRVEMRVAAANAQIGWLVRLRADGVGTVGLRDINEGCCDLRLIP